MANFFAELKRRHIYRVGAAYVVVAWALTQLVDVLSQVFALPGSIAQPMLVLLAIGFPVALIAAWMIESKPHQAVASAVRSRPTVVDWTLCGALALVVVLIGYERIAPPEQAGVNAARSASLNPAGAISLAVLPFNNLSGDASQEFFSDGMTEEITSALARIPDLRVVARTSAFQFKQQNRDIQTIGQQLNATHFIEGSVRKAGDRVRITAQLIKADDSTHLWTETYDRQLTDIFAIQEEIGRAIAGSLRMSLGLKPGENLVNSRSIDSESYQQYLRAIALIQGRARARYIEATALLEQITSRHPDYAPAWSLLNVAYFFMINSDPARNAGSVDEFRRVVEVYSPKMEAAARRAVQLDPNFAGGYGGLGIVQLERGNMLAASELWSKARALDPDEPRMLHGRSIELGITGQMQEAITVRRQLQAVEPFVPVYNRFTALYLWVDGQNEAAIAILNALPPDAPNRLGDLARVYASMGRYTEAADMLEKAPPGNLTSEILKEAARLLRTAPAKAAAPRNLPSLATLDWVYLHVGAPERALEFYEFGVKSGFVGAANLPFVWHPSYAPVRKTERFKAYVRALGLVDYWRAMGWPEFCRPTTADDFVCN